MTTPMIDIPAARAICERTKGLTSYKRDIQLYLNATMSNEFFKGLDLDKILIDKESEAERMQLAEANNALVIVPPSKLESMRKKYPRVHFETLPSEPAIQGAGLGHLAIDEAADFVDGKWVIK